MKTQRTHTSYARIIWLNLSNRNWSKYESQLTVERLFFDIESGPSSIDCVCVACESSEENIELEKGKTMYYTHTHISIKLNWTGTRISCDRMNKYRFIASAVPSSTIIFLYLCSCATVKIYLFLFVCRWMLFNVNIVDVYKHHSHSHTHIHWQEMRCVYSEPQQSWITIRWNGTQ